MKVSHVFAVGIIVACICLLFAGISGAAQDQPQKAPGAGGAQKAGQIAERLREFDANGDGLISRSEWIAAGRRDEGFNLIDTNKDGNLNREELQQGLQQLSGAAKQKQPGDQGGQPLPPALVELQNEMKNLFATADGNGDGELSLKEIQTVRPEFQESRFKELDVNGSGAISQDEIRQYGQKFRQQYGEKSKQQPLQPQAGQSFDRLFTQADKDGNSSVSKDEYIQFSTTEFDRLDANKDGSLSRDEMRPRLVAPGQQPVRRTEENPTPGAVKKGENVNKAAAKGVEKGTGQGKNKQQQQGKSDQAQSKINEYDTDKNGSVSYKELKAKLPDLNEELFKAMDTNGDGQLSASELG